MKEISLYIHIPFCSSKCLYCDFTSFPLDLKRAENYTKALIKEIELYSKIYKDYEIPSVFIGGGTPTILPYTLLTSILDNLHKHFNLTSLIEFTCEANPGTLSNKYLSLLSSAGINRLSLGAQAYQKELLELLGREHDWQDVEEAVLMAKKSGIDNINIDLMYGLPKQNELQWLESLRQTNKLDISHISCYSLIVEDNTPLKAKISSGTYTLPEEDLERQMYLKSLEYLSSNSYKHYEISNFAKEGFECIHNLRYWQGDNYLGLGLAAHGKLSLEGKKDQDLAYKRYQNTKNLSLYTSSLSKYALPIEQYEHVSKKDAYFETIIMGLRLIKGISEKSFRATYGLSIDEAFPGVLAPLIEKGLLECKEDMLKLSPRGLDLQNQVLLNFLP